MNRLIPLALAALVAACGQAQTSPSPSPSPSPSSASTPTAATALTLTCPLDAADLSGLPPGFDLFDPGHGDGSLVFYLSVDLTQMDLSPDSPVPSATVPSISYTPATITVVDQASCTGQRIDNGEIRYKGNTTFDKPKRQFKLKIPKDDAIGVYRRLNLHSAWKDATLFREKLVYDLFEDAGVIAPRANHALVFVEDLSQGGGYAYGGLYTLVEQVNSRFLERRLTPDSGAGNLYKAYYGYKGQNRGFCDLRVEGDSSPANYRGGNGWADTYEGNARAYRLKTNEDENMDDYSDLAAFVKALDEGDVASHLDVDAFVGWLAVNTLIGGWDNYWYNAQNYYLYHGDNNWLWIPWDHDNTLGNNFQDHNGFHIESEDILYRSYPHNALTAAVLADATWRGQYLDALEALIDGPFTTSAFEARLTTLRADLGDAARADTFKQYDNDLWLGNQGDVIVTYSDEDGDFGNKAHHLGILSYIEARSQSVRSQIAAAREGAPSPRVTSHNR